MAAAFATYLGPYKHSFRRQMLTVHWPECLQERGVPLLLDDAPHVVTDTNSKEDFNEQKSEVSNHVSVSLTPHVFMSKLLVPETELLWSRNFDPC